MGSSPSAKTRDRREGAGQGVAGYWPPLVGRYSANFPGGNTTVWVVVQSSLVEAGWRKRQRQPDQRDKQPTSIQVRGQGEGQRAVL